MSRPAKHQLDPAIHRVRLEKLTIFEISESELEALERGSPDSLFLNLAIAVISVAVSFSITLATADIESNRTFVVFVIVTVISYIASVTLGLLWWTSRANLKSVAREIRGRQIPQGIQESDRQDTIAT